MSIQNQISLIVLWYSNDRIITVEIDFKNTSSSDALAWYHKSKESKIRIHIKF